MFFCEERTEIENERVRETEILRQREREKPNFSENEMRNYYFLKQ
jgi:hypothetical protein